jgi:hypothetical protein
MMTGYPTGCNDWEGLHNWSDECCEQGHPRLFGCDGAASEGGQEGQGDSARGGR